MPKVSIIIPCYNCGEYIDDLILSLKKQSLTDIEIIFVNDGSTDNSEEIIQKYLSDDNRIKYIYQENQGGGIARNTGIQNSQSEYVICIDADDTYENNMAEKLYNKAKETDADITICKFKRCDILTGRLSHGKGIDTRKLPDSKTFCAKDVRNILQITNPGPCNKLYKKEFITKNNLKYSGTRIINDLKFGMIALCLAEKIAVVDEDLSTYRYQISGSSSKNRETKLECSLKVFKEIYNEFCERNLFEEYKHIYFEKIMDTIKYEMSFPISENILNSIKEFLTQEPLNILSEKNKEQLFKIKKVKKQCFEYTILTILTLGLNSSLKYKLKNHNQALKNIKYLLY